MSKLLRSDFRRLAKSKTAMLCLLAECLLAFAGVMSRVYYTNELGEPGYDTVKGLYFFDMQCYPVLVAVFVGIFIGIEFADKTIRNKLIVGHSKINVYLSNLVVTSVALLLMHIVYCVTVLGLSFAFFDGFTITGTDYWLSFFCSLATIIATNAVILMCCMLMQNMAFSSIVCILLALGFIIFGLNIQGALENPPTIGGYEYEYGGEIIQVPSSKNPHYVGGALRAIYTFLNDFLPGGQGLTINLNDALPSQYVTMTVYALILTMLSTFVGIYGFKRRNMK